MTNNPHSTVRDDELVDALKTWAGNLKYGPDQDWLEQAVDRITDLQTRLERYETALVAEIERMISTERGVARHFSIGDEHAAAKHRIDALNKVLDFIARKALGDSH